MATPTALPLETYLRTAYRPDCDYVDGELQERHFGEKDHARLQALLLLFFAAPSATPAASAVGHGQRS